MPATYAHYRFGQRCIDVLPDSIKELVEANRQLFDIGVHGPDILFYYEAYHSNRVNRIGFGMHEKLASDFFKKARLAYASSSYDKKRMMAYLLGFVSHFTLDYMSHSYVEAKEYYSHVSHTEIETQNDRHLMIIDGHDPLSYDTVQHIIPSKDNAEVIHEFFKELSVNDIHTSLKSMVFFIHLLTCPNRFKRGFVFSGMKLIGVYDKLHEQVVSVEADPNCEDSNLRLDKLADKALPLFARLANNLFAFLNGQSDLDDIFNHTFGAQDNWKNIPVLTVEREKEYEIQDDFTRKEVGSV